MKPLSIPVNIVLLWTVGIVPCSFVYGKAAKIKHNPTFDTIEKPLFNLYLEIGKNDFVQNVSGDVPLWNDRVIKAKEQSVVGVSGFDLFRSAHNLPQLDMNVVNGDNPN
ncbi:hypothetical protein [Pedobacter paludis]|uniref:hypothetical protein n=1 Tax=Pedobacter paludis TaxID=2203212 RepID=UPI0011B1ECF2|nr:hypothetical protein [Pedobacter paludis]